MLNTKKAARVWLVLAAVCLLLTGSRGMHAQAGLRFVIRNRDRFFGGCCQRRYGYSDQRRKGNHAGDADERQRRLDHGSLDSGYV